MGFIEKQKVQEISERFNEVDFNYFASKGANDISLLLKIATDWGFQYEIVNGRMTLNNNSDLLALVNLGVDIASTIPGLAELINIFEFVGLNFGTWGIISDSATAKGRLEEWMVYIKNWTDYESFKPTQLINKFSKLVEGSPSIIEQRPKCRSLTTNCGNEHIIWIKATKIVKEAQAGVFELYVNFMREDKIQEFVTTYFRTETNVFSDNPNPIAQSSLAKIAGVIGLGFLFSKLG